MVETNYFINLIYILLPEDFSLKYDFIRLQVCSKTFKGLLLLRVKPTPPRVHDRFLSDGLR